jgi:endonuclease/exonuclease/phosphatase family metal-dependent hydrolase
VRVNPLVVASYNIHRGVGLDRRRDLDRIAAVIEEMRPDVVGLQEVVRAAGPAQADQAGYLARRLGMELVMGVTRELAGGLYGNALLTRLPIVASATHDLSHGRRERRGALRVDLDSDGRWCTSSTVTSVWPSASAGDRSSCSGPSSVAPRSSAGPACSWATSTSGTGAR